MNEVAVNKNDIPAIWKLAKIVPVLKPGKSPNEGTSYRPLSLLSPIAKVLEKLILPEITNNIDNIKIQHGYKNNTQQLQLYIKSKTQFLKVLIIDVHLNVPF